jgi:hypothetical protein
LLALLLLSAARVSDSGTVTVAVLKLAENGAFGIAAIVLLRGRQDLRIITALLACCAGLFGGVGAEEIVQTH